MAFQWNPALLAREVATVDDLTGGRLELGLRTGYVQSEHDRAGLPFGPAGERVDHLRHTVEEMDRLLSAGDHDGLHRGAGTARAVRLHVSDGCWRRPWRRSHRGTVPAEPPAAGVRMVEFRVPGRLA
ncbi:luciferase-like monooxygenase [Streptomyces sp. BK205]|nr:luciferase-like monooxygenase [Streptomyces sp. BK205]